MSLFGPAFGDSAPTVTRRAAPAPAPAVPLPAPVQANTQADAELPAFERRAQLRAKRHRLVADLARDVRSSHKEVNAQVNRTLGIDSVDKATIEQLERSIDWLDRRLYGSK